MVKTVEGTFDVDGASLYTKTWLPEDDVPLRAKMIMIHGFNDHVNRYYGFFPYLAERGISVYAMDQRGWGRSVKTHAEKGRTGPTARVLADMAAFIGAQLPSDVPVFLLGHSMGGGQVLALASTPAYESLTRQLRGIILESPFLGFAPELQPSWLTVFSGRLASHVVPHFKLYRPIPPEDVTRCPDVQASIRDDSLLHNYGTLEGLAGMLDRTDGLSSGKLVLKKNLVRSLLLVHGDADKATSFHRSREWFDKVATENVQDAKFKNFVGFAHQLHADPGKEEFYEDVASWILERSAEPETGREGKAAQPHL